MNAPATLKQAQEAQRLAEMLERSRAIAEGRDAEWNSFLDGIKARAAANPVKRARPVSDVQFDRDQDAADGGQDIVRNTYGAI